MPAQLRKPFLITIPHSGERVPAETPWLSQLPETLLMFDVDRYVDRLYQPVIDALHIPSIKTEWHRYACDLNRFPDDVDADSVLHHKNPSGAFPLRLALVDHDLKRTAHAAADAARNARQDRASVL